MSSIIDELYMYLRKESESAELQEVPRDLLRKVRDEIERLRSSLGVTYVKDQVIERKIESITQLLTALILTRLSKLLSDLKFLSVDTSRLLDEERDIVNYLQEKIRSMLITYVGKVPENLRATITATEQRREYVIVLFTKDYPPLMCSDLHIYGPFSREDVAYIPKADAEKLREKGVVIVLGQVPNMGES
ncbi:MAG: hypothetical protein DRJ40_09295 [Thermoprotei archaeon]|nr:MAG: hypothetical protein DRJ40_09295 [Thermoprotei archaeon]